MEIVLIRHGKPASANNLVVNAGEYTKWIRQYNLSAVDSSSRPVNINEQYRSFYVVASDLKRARHSAYIYMDKKVEEIDKIYREMEVPRYKIPLKLKAWNWVYLSRFLWLLGFKGSFESFKQAKKRAELATERLIALAEKHENLVLFGHGFMNRYIRKSLIKKGWQLDAKSHAFWGITTLKYPTVK